MKKILSTFLVAIALMLAVPANAQLIKFGVKGGVNLNKVDFSSSTTSKNYTGFYFGPTAEINIPFFGFGVDGSLLYSQKGINPTDANSSNTTIKEAIVPINLKYTLGSSKAGVFIAVGPQFAFNLDKSANDGQRDYSFKSANTSFNIGVGAKLLGHIQVNATYNIPIDKGAKYSNGQVSTSKKVWNCKTKGWQLGMTYMF